MIIPMNKNCLVVILILLLSGCAASMHPDYKPMYQKVDVQQEKLDLIRQQFDSQGLSDAIIGRDAIGRLKLEGTYANEKDVAKAFEIARSVAGISAVSPVTPANIKRKDWEVALTEGLAQYIERIAIKYNMAVSTSSLSVSPDQSPKAPSKKMSEGADAAGLDTQVFDNGLNGNSQFEVGASEPNSNARQFYSEIAKKMVEDNARDTGGKNKKILLIGHTDDTGDTQFNAKLSEERARAIGQIFSSAGINSANIFYQGAGETLPIADNSSLEGRARNRRVEMLELKDEQTLDAFLINRRPNVAYYRPVESKKIKSQHAVTKKESSTVKTTESNKPVIDAKKTPNLATANVTDNKLPDADKKVIAKKDQLDFGGSPINETNSKLNAGDFVMTKTAFSLISNAQATPLRIGSCNFDRPRNAGLVKSLKTNSVYKPADYLPGLYGRTWYNMAGNHLVVLNEVRVLRNGVVPANKPELKVYSNYKSVEAVPDVYINPDVNAYQATNGIVYRVFANGEKGMQCIDILMPLNNIPLAKEAKIIYGSDTSFVADFKPKRDN